MIFRPPGRIARLPWYAQLLAGIVAGGLTVAAVALVTSWR